MALTCKSLVNCIDGSQMLCNFVAKSVNLLLIELLASLVSLTRFEHSNKLEHSVKKTIIHYFILLTSYGFSVIISSIFGTILIWVTNQSLCFNDMSYSQMCYKCMQMETSIIALEIEVYTVKKNITKTEAVYPRALPL